MTHPHVFALSTRVDKTSYEDAANTVVSWIGRQHWTYVCVANVHMVMEAYDSPEYSGIVNGASLVTADGMPLVWALRMRHGRECSRVYGPRLMLRLLDLCSEAGIPIGLYGGTAQALEQLQGVLRRGWPRLAVAYAYSPPFGDLTPENDAAVVDAVNASGARLLFVGLGCPKQERWMADHQGRVQAVLLGVGAAFDFLSHAKRQAPEWMQAAGLEWLFRLATEPRRLWRRYLYNNPRFVLLFALQLLGARHAGGQHAEN